MAKNGSKSAPAWKGFFNYYLTEEEKGAIKKLGVKEPATIKRIGELADNGYKLSVTYSVDKRAYFVTCTGSANCPSNQGYSLTQAHADLSVAVACVWFVCSEVYQWDAWPVENSADENFEW